MKHTFFNFFKIILSIFLWISSISIFLIFIKFALNSLWELFISVLANDSVSFRFSEMNFLSVVEVSFFIALTLFIFFIMFVLTLFTLSELKLITKRTMNNLVDFFEKFLIAVYPALSLAASLSEASFSLITNVISFFVIFTFVFRKKPLE